jgi:hypothetical protein
MSIILLYTEPCTKLGFAESVGTSWTERIAPASSQTTRGWRVVMSEDRVSMSDDPSVMLEGISMDAITSPLEGDREVTCRVYDANDLARPTT